MLDLQQVTLVLVDGRADYLSYTKSLHAIEQSLSHASFNSIKFFTAHSPLTKPTGYEKIDPIDINGYNYFLITQLAKHIKTSHVLIVQHDGFILNPNYWDQEFLKYDYIGAPWPTELTQDPNKRVGNGGFSLRSKKLLDTGERIYRVPQQPITNRINRSPTQYSGITHNEDFQICIVHRHLFEAQGCTFAPVALAAKFALEIELPDHDNDLRYKFGFHGPRHFETVKRLYNITI